MKEVVSDSSSSAARILRAIRIAARLGFQISRETAHFVKNLSCSILRLDKVCSKPCASSALFMYLVYMIMAIQLILSHLDVSGKASDGNELHAGIWFCWSIFKVIVEVWTPRDTSTHSGKNLIVLYLQLISYCTESSDVTSFCRQHILLVLASEDVTKDLTCFWYVCWFFFFFFQS